MIGAIHQTHALKDCTASLGGKSQVGNEMQNGIQILGLKETGVLQVRRETRNVLIRGGKGN